MEKYNSRELERMADKFLIANGSGNLVAKTEEIEGDLFYSVNPTKTISFSDNRGRGKLEYSQDGKSFYIENIEAVPCFCGIGKYLLGELEEKARLKNIKAIFGSVNSLSPDAREFFCRNGFYEEEVDNTLVTPEITVRKIISFR